MYTPTVLLPYDSDYWGWLTLIETLGYLLEVWEFIDPKKDDVNVIPDVPTMPEELEMMAKVTHIDGVVSPEQCKSYQMALNHFFDSTIFEYGRDMHQYYQRLHNLEKIEAFLDSTVNVQLYGSIINADVGLREKLKLLALRCDEDGGSSTCSSSTGGSLPRMRPPPAKRSAGKSVRFEGASTPEDGGWAGKKGDVDQATTKPLNPNWDVVYDAIDNLKNEQCTATKETRTTDGEKTIKSRSGLPLPLKTGATAKPATLEKFGRCEWCRHQHVPEGEREHWKSCYYCLPELCADMKRRVFFTEGKRWENVHKRLHHHPEVYRKIIRFQIDQSMKEWRAHQDNAAGGADALPNSPTASKPADPNFW